MRAVAAGGVAPGESSAAGPLPIRVQRMARIKRLRLSCRAEQNAKLSQLSQSHQLYLVRQPQIPIRTSFDPVAHPYSAIDSFWPVKYALSIGRRRKQSAPAIRSFHIIFKTLQRTIVQTFPKFSSPPKCRVGLLRGSCLWETFHMVSGRWVNGLG